MRPVKILYVTPWCVDPPKSASEARALSIARALQQVGNVEVALVRPDPPNAHTAIADTCPFPIACDLNVTTLANSSWIRKAKWILEPRLPHPHGVGVDEHGAQLFRNVARAFDLVWFHKVRTANMFSDWEWPQSVVDVDDVSSQFERSMISSTMSAPKQLATWLRVWSWRRREQLLGERFKILAVCSEVDKRYLTRLGVSAPIRVIPNGYDRPAVPPARRLASPPRLGFIGVFDHAPNVEGMNWFTEHCWPQIKRRIPEARLRLVGRFTDGDLKPAGPDIDALGYLPYPNEEMATWSAMVVPIRAGAGTRGKIAHAFSQKCPVVSTGLGALGYEPIHGREMLLGESGHEFADACILAIQQPLVAAEMAERAWNQFLKSWTWDGIGSQIRRTAEECLAASR